MGLLKKVNIFLINSNPDRYDDQDNLSREHIITILCF
jgi:hypothetical protein